MAIERAPKKNTAAHPAPRKTQALKDLREALQLLNKTGKVLRTSTVTHCKTDLETAVDKLRAGIRFVESQPDLEPPTIGIGLPPGNSSSPWGSS